MNTPLGPRGAQVAALLVAATALAACQRSDLTLPAPVEVLPVEVADQTIEELLAANPSISPDIVEAIEWSSDVGPTIDAHPGAGSFEPFLAGDWDTATGTGTATLAPGGVLTGKVIVTNPSGADFTGTVLCLVNGEPDRCLVDGDRARTVRVPYRTGFISDLAVDGAAEGDELTVLFLVHEDRMDPLPASAGVLVIVGEAGAVASREFEDWPATPHEAECNDKPMFVVPEETRRRVISRTDPLNVRVETCSPARFVPFLVADYQSVVTPDGWNAFAAGPGTVDLEVPAAVLSDPTVDVLNFGFVVYVNGRSHVRFSEEVHLE